MNKLKEKKFQKLLDKSYKLWYNIIVLKRYRKELIANEYKNLF